MTEQADTPAIAAHKRSIAYASAGEKEKWLALFADDAVVHDPVGPSPHDPEGKGFRGRDEISRFWDLMIGPINLMAIPHKRIAVGPNIAAVVLTAATITQGQKTYIEMVAIYTVNNAGKLVSLQAYWDLNAVAAQLAQPSA